ncbi:MAG: hypothetical protein JO266_12820 [Acidobacteria bacterium]|nr:hypothetical protein [Acidobacteriota bacterium]
MLALLPAVLTRYARGQVRVTISPANVTFPTVARQAFTATVSGSSNTAVILQVDGAGRGNSTAGLVSTTLLGTVEEAIYLPPASVPHPATVSVTAVCQADPPKSALATVTVQLPFRSGHTYYVSTAGHDSNRGTFRALWPLFADPPVFTLRLDTSETRDPADFGSSERGNQPWREHRGSSRLSRQFTGEQLWRN